eukprot:357233-Chlamydomonas_euryale.AAC.8
MVFLACEVDGPGKARGTEASTPCQQSRGIAIGEEAGRRLSAWQRMNAAEHHVLRAHVHMRPCRYVHFIVWRDGSVCECEVAFWTTLCGAAPRTCGDTHIWRAWLLMFMAVACQDGPCGIWHTHVRDFERAFAVLQERKGSELGSATMLPSTSCYTPGELLESFFCGRDFSFHTLPSLSIITHTHFPTKLSTSTAVVNRIAYCTVACSVRAPSGPACAGRRRG